MKIGSVFARFAIKGAIRLAILSGLSACQTPGPEPSSPQHIEQRHEAALSDAAHVVEGKNYAELFAINDKNSRISRDTQDWPYDVFVEMWIDPHDLFRPCVDPEIDDTQRNLAFTSRRVAVPNIPDTRDFYEHLYFKSFRHRDRMPWTGLGYTCDWGREDKHVGASEYIVRPDAPYSIERVVSAQMYCQPSW